MSENNTSDESLLGLTDKAVPSSTQSARRSFVPERVEIEGVDLVKGLATKKMAAGRYLGSSPYSTASKVATKYVQKAKTLFPGLIKNESSVTLRVAIRETTQGSKKGSYEYTVVRTAVDATEKPIKFGAATGVPSKAPPAEQKPKVPRPRTPSRPRVVVAAPPPKINPPKSIPSKTNPPKSNPIVFKHVNKVKSVKKPLTTRTAKA